MQLPKIKIPEVVKQLFGKAFSVGGIAAVNAIAQSIVNTPEVTVQFLVLVGAYAFWTQGIVPVVNAFFEKELSTSKKSTAALPVSGVTNYLKLV